MLLYSLAIHPRVEELQAHFPSLLLKAWYADDGMLIVATPDAPAMLSFLQIKGSEWGFHLDLSKTRLVAQSRPMHQTNNPRHLGRTDSQPSCVCPRRANRRRFGMFRCAPETRAGCARLLATLYRAGKPPAGLPSTPSRHQRMPPDLLPSEYPATHYLDHRS